MLLKPITSRYHLWWMVLVLAGCGFHLRSYNFTGSIESFAIAGKTRLSITEPLRQGLKQAGAVEVTDGTPSIVIELLDQRRDRRSASTAGRVIAASSREGEHAQEDCGILLRKMRILHRIELRSNSSPSSKASIPGGSSELRSPT